MPCQSYEICIDFYSGGKLIEKNKNFCRVRLTRCCTLRRAKNTPTHSFVSNLYISTLITRKCCKNMENS